MTSPPFRAFLFLLSLISKWLSTLWSGLAWLVSRAEKEGDDVVWWEIVPVLLLEVGVEVVRRKSGLLLVPSVVAHLPLSAIRAVCRNPCSGTTRPILLIFSLFAALRRV